MRCEGCWRLRCNTDAERASRVAALQQQARWIAWRGAKLSAGRKLPTCFRTVWQKSFAFV